MSSILRGGGDVGRVRRRCHLVRARGYDFVVARLLFAVLHGGRPSLTPRLRLPFLRRAFGTAGVGHFVELPVTPLGEVEVLLSASEVFSLGLTLGPDLFP